MNLYPLENVTPTQLREMAVEKQAEADKYYRIGNYQSGNGYYSYMKMADALRSEAQGYRCQAQWLEEKLGIN